MAWSNGTPIGVTLIYLWRQLPLLRERFIVLLSGGHDHVEMGAPVPAPPGRPETTG